MALIKIKQIDGLQTDLNALEGVDSTQSTAIANLEAVDSTQSTAISNLEGDVADLATVDSTQSTAIANLEAVDSTQSTAISNLEGDVADLEAVDSTQSTAIAGLEASVTSIESAFVKDPFGIETFPAPVTAADTVASISLAGSIEDAVNGNIVSVSVNGVVLAANSSLGTAGQEGYNVTGAQAVSIRLGYALDANDEIFIKYVTA